MDARGKFDRSMGAGTVATGCGVEIITMSGYLPTVPVENDRADDLILDEIKAFRLPVRFLGFTLGKNGKDIYVRVHGKSWKKMKSKLKELISRRSVQGIHPSLEKIKVYMRGWLNYYGIADMKNKIDECNLWLYHRIHMCIWKQWKKPKTKVRNLMKLGVPKDLAR